jgi:hypothetical protein
MCPGDSTCFEETLIIKDFGSVPDKDGNSDRIQVWSGAKCIRSLIVFVIGQYVNYLLCYLGWLCMLLVNCDLKRLCMNMLELNE